DQLAGSLPHGRPVQAPAGDREARLVKDAEGEVLGDAHPGHTGVAKGLLGEAEDLVAPELHPSRPIRLAVNGDGARGSLALYGEDLDHLGLAVPGNAGDPHDLPGVDEIGRASCRERV